MVAASLIGGVLGYFMHVSSTRRWQLVNARFNYERRYQAQLERDLALGHIKPFDSKEYLRSKGIPESVLWEE